MSFETLTIFVSAARTGSLLGAAKACETTRGRVRRRLEELEAWAQTDLFVRGRAGLELTGAGRLLFERVEPMVGELRVVQEQLQHEGEVPSGRLTIAANALTPSFGVPELMSLLQHHMPEVCIQGKVCEDVTEELRAGSEVGLLLAETVPPGPWTAFRAVALDVGAYATPRYLEQHGCPATPNDLSRHQLTAWKHPGFGGGAWPLKAGGAIEVEPVMIASYGEPIHRLVEAGLAIGLYAASAFDDRGLVRVLPEVVGYRAHVWVLLARATMALPRVRELHRLLALATDQLGLVEG